MLPVWMYWEGIKPQWIENCQQTVFRHAPNVRLLSADDYDGLRDHDRDIDLSVLHVSHRADFIRADVLANHGGLWIDSDCVVMKNLEPLLNTILHWDYVGYKEHGGGVSNGLMGARRGSEIMNRFFQNICAILRSKQGRSWSTIGSDALTNVIAKANRTWLNIDARHIAPIAWTNPQKYLHLEDDYIHENGFNPNALTYMMYNQALIKHVRNDLDCTISQPKSFFSFLLRKSATT